MKDYNIKYRVNNQNTFNRKQSGKDIPEAIMLLVATIEINFLLQAKPKPRIDILTIKEIKK
jgi:hypothetical protein